MPKHLLFHPTRPLFASVHRLMLGLLVWGFVGGTPAVSQVLKPIEWTHTLNTDSDPPQAVFRAKIDADWYLYSSDFSEELGPIVTSFEWTPHASYALAGALVPVNPLRAYDSLFEGEYTYFKGEATFRQALRLSPNTSPNIQGLIVYQVCSTITGQCILLEESFAFGEAADATPLPLDVKDSLPSTHTLTEATESPQAPSKEDSLAWFFMVAFLAGLAALLTPCVFPLIPMTVSYFTQKDEQSAAHPIRDVLIYALCIIGIYALIGFCVAPFMGPETANALATGWIPNLLFFLVFFVFGLSFLGMFEIVLPARWVNFADSRANKKSFLGLFFMALTLVLVTFSCTGPIIGSLLVQSAGGLKLKPVVGMMGYALAFALPFSLFALFPKWLSNLPRSGGWLNRMKVTLGFLELAFSLKFLSVIDQVYHLRLLDREVYLSLWIVLFASLGWYWMGKIRLAADAPAERLSVARLLIAMASFAFVVYLVPGLFGAPLRALSGYLPPRTTQDFNLDAPAQTLSPQNQTLCHAAPLHADILKLPHNLQGYFDYSEALACARQQNKPLFIDFTGHGCVNCREMEARVWADPRILRRLKEDFIVLALYIDERRPLPDSLWYVSSYDNKLKKTIGKQNADIQIRRFNNNAQPYYVLLGLDEEVLTAPIAYELNIERFAEFLDKGKNAFQKKHLNVQP